MSERDDDQAERPHEATAHRLDKARQEGQFPQSRDLVTWLLLLTSMGGLLVLGASWGRQLVELLQWAMDNAPAGDLNSLWHAGQWYVWLLELGGLLGLLWCVAAVMPLAMVRFQVVFTLKWRGQRLDPIQGLGRVFSVRSLAEAGKNLLKTTALLAVLAFWWRDWAWDLQKMTTNGLLPALAHALRALLMATAAVMAVVTLIAALDVFMQWRLFQREMRMSTQELREESKETEGSPEVRQRLRQRRFEIARLRTLSAVEKADVLVTNPEHYAVALRYEAGRMKAPEVIAKGADAIAQQMKQVARQHNIPMTEAPPLARWMYHRLKVGQAVPSALFEAVAKVLAWAYEYRDAGHETRPLPDLGPMPSEF